MPWNDYIQKIKTEQNKCDYAIAQLEKNYFEETILFGNVFKGWEFYFNLKKNPDSIQQKKSFKIFPKNRLYSLSSVSSIIAKGHEKEEKAKD